MSHLGFASKSRNLSVLQKNVTGFSSVVSETSKTPHVGFHLVSGDCRWVRQFGSPAVAEASTSDGLTVEGIIAGQWPILDESESDWKSHAAAIAQSIHLIKKRLQACNLKSTLIIKL